MRRTTVAALLVSLLAFTAGCKKEDCSNTVTPGTPGKVYVNTSCK